MKHLTLVLRRDVFTETETLGMLSANGKFFCYVLEDVVRDPKAKKVHGQTAIPEGHYKVSFTMSNRFKRLMPLIENVPNFQGVRIHGGNHHKNTEGCLLVAYNRYLKKPFPGEVTIRNWIQGSAEKDITKLIQQHDSCSIIIK